MTIHDAIAAPGCGCDARDRLKSLVSIDDALGIIATHAEPVAGSEAVPLGQATGRILGRPVRTRVMVPSFDNAAMDGYAIRVGPVPSCLEIRLKGGP